MRAKALLFIGLSAAVIGSVSMPAVADAAQARHRAPVARKAAPRIAPRPLDLSNHGPSVAMQAAQAAQAAGQPGAAQALALRPTAAPMAASPGSVAGLTVTPTAPVQGKVIASTDATSLASPNFSVADAADKPMAIGIGSNAALGKQVMDNRPAGGSLLTNNPELFGAQPTRSDVGVTSVH